jgi:hypothetical protein
MLFYLTVYIILYYLKLLNNVIVYSECIVK